MIGDYRSYESGSCVLEALLAHVKNGYTHENNYVNGGHMDRRSVLLLVLLLVILGGIFALTQQSTKDTSNLSWRVEQWLVRVFPPTGTGSAGEPTWFGLTIRRLAHVVEFGALGLAASALALQLMGPGPRTAVLTALVCLGASLVDEIHKTFVPGRHFDPKDLILDAVGYMLAILLVFGLAHLLSRNA